MYFVEYVPLVHDETAVAIMVIYSLQYIQVLELMAEIIRSKMEFLPLEISVSFSVNMS